MPYNIACDECDFHKVRHRMDAAQDLQDEHEEETGHDAAIQEFRMNGEVGSLP